MPQVSLSPLQANEYKNARTAATACCKSYSSPHDAANFPESWIFKGITCDDPGDFPDGAQYGVAFERRQLGYVTGYSAAVSTGVEG